MVKEDKWIEKCTKCYHCYKLAGDDLELHCKRADKGKECRFYGEKEHTARIKRNRGDDNERG